MGDFRQLDPFLTPTRITPYFVGKADNPAFLSNLHAEVECKCRLCTIEEIQQ
jgi:hypothetical protein